MKVSITGTVADILEPKTFASGFQVCTVVVQVGSNKYPVEFKGDDVATALTLRTDIELTLDCYLNSREYNGRYYVELKAAKVRDQREGESSRTVPQNASNAMQAPSQPSQIVYGRTTGQTQAPTFETPSTTSDLPF
jgi:hypothetical protein